MIKYFFIALLVHVVLLKVIWVGFSVSAQEKLGDIVYTGRYLGISQSKGLGKLSRNNDSSILITTNGAENYKAWVNQRSLEMPRRNK